MGSPETLRTTTLDSCCVEAGVAVVAEGDAAGAAGAFSWAEAVRHREPKTIITAMEGHRDI